MSTALVYVRISRDPDGQRAGVQRQRSDCLDFAKKCGWSVALVIEDNDRGAYSGKSRPGWDETMDQIESGSIDYLVAWANDRLTRHPRELEDLIDLLEATGTQVATVTSGNYDLATPEGRAHARIIGAIARQESERKSVRQKAANRHRAMSGQRVGGRRPFGYEQDGLTVRRAEAEIVEEAALRVIAGESIRAIRLDLGARGIKTTTGRQWTNSRLSEMLRNPRYAGKRTYLGEVVADAEWPALLPSDVWSKLQSVLTAPDRRWRGGPLKRWMTRVASCGRCGEPLVAGQVSRQRGPTYTCTTDRGCGRLAIKADWLEQYIAGLILDALSEESATSRFVAHDVDADELRAIETELDTIRRKVDQADRDYEADVLDRSRWLARVERLGGRVEQLEALRDRRLRTATAVDLPDGQVTPWWEALEPEMRRKVARLLFSEVMVAPARNLGGRPDWERIKVTWAA